MKLQIEVQSLCASLRMMQTLPGAERNAISMIGVKLTADEMDGLTISRCSNEAVISIALPADVADGGEIVVDFEMLRAIVERSGSKTLDIELKDTHLLITGQGTKARTALMAKEEWPTAPEPEKKGWKMSLNSQRFAECLRAASLAACGPQDARANLEGVILVTSNFEGESALYAIGADGRRMHAARIAECDKPVVKNDDGEDDGLLIPPVTVAALMAAASDGQEAVLKVGSRLSITIGNYMAVLPLSGIRPTNLAKFLGHSGAQGEIDANRNDLVTAIKSCLPLGFDGGEGRGRDKQIQLKPGISVLTVEADNQKGASMETDISATLTSAPRYRCRGSYLLNALTVGQGETVKLEIWPNGECCAIREPGSFAMVFGLKE